MWIDDIIFWKMQGYWTFKLFLLWIIAQKDIDYYLYIISGNQYSLSLFIPIQKYTKIINSHKNYGLLTFQR